MTDTIALSTLLNLVPASANGCEYCGRDDHQAEDRSRELQRHLVVWAREDWQSFVVAYATLASDRRSVRDVAAMLTVSGKPILSRNSIARALIRARDRWGVDALPRAAGARRVR